MRRSSYYYAPALPFELSYPLIIKYFIELVPRGQADEAKNTGITLDTRPESRNNESVKKADPTDRNPSKDPLARMEKTVRLHCINLQMAVRVEKNIKYMLTLESRRFLVLGEVSLCVRTLPNPLKKQSKELLLHCLLSKIIKITLNVHLEYLLYKAESLCVCVCVCVCVCL